MRPDIATLSTVAVVIPKLFAIIFPCQTCGPKLSINASGLGELVCPAEKNFPNTQILYTALIVVSGDGQEAPAKAHLLLDVNPGAFQQSIQGIDSNGVFDSTKKTYFISGTPTSDNISGVPGASFNIDGAIGSKAQIFSSAGNEYTYGW